MWQVCKIVCRMRIQVHFPLISLLYITISPSDSGTFYLIISDHLAICSFFIEVNILLHKITTALILLTSSGNAIFRLSDGGDFSKFSVRSAPTDSLSGSHPHGPPKNLFLHDAPA